jgi:hypothetical protein
VNDFNFGNLVGPLGFAIAGVGAWLIFLWFERRSGRQGS